MVVALSSNEWEPAVRNLMTLLRMQRDPWALIEHLIWQIDRPRWSFAMGWLRSPRVHRESAWGRQSCERQSWHGLIPEDYECAWKDTKVSVTSPIWNDSDDWPSPVSRPCMASSRKADWTLVKSRSLLSRTPRLGIILTFQWLLQLRIVLQLLSNYTNWRIYNLKRRLQIWKKGCWKTFVLPIVGFAMMFML